MDRCCFSRRVAVAHGNNEVTHTYRKKPREATESEFAPPLRTYSDNSFPEMKMRVSLNSLLYTQNGNAEKRMRDKDKF